MKTYTLHELTDLLKKFHEYDDIQIDLPMALLCICEELFKREKNEP